MQSKYATGTCRGCHEPLNENNDSAAHIIPNALGGRLDPTGLICRDCNTQLDRIADNALVEAFGAWPTLLDIPRDRGENPPKVVPTRAGHKVRVEADGSLSRVDVEYKVTPIADGHKLEISAGDWKTARQLIQRGAKQFSQLDPAVAESYAQVVKMDADDHLNVKLDFSPRAVFGGAISVFWLFLLDRTGHPIMEWDRLLKCIAAMQSNGGKMRYLVEGLPGLRGPQIDLGHKIVIRTIPSTGNLIAFVEILGTLRIGGLLAKGPIGTSCEHIYVYDISEETDRSKEFSIDAAVFDNQDWLTVGLGPTDVSELKCHFEQGLHRLAAHYYKPSS